MNKRRSQLPLSDLPTASNFEAQLLEYQAKISSILESFNDAFFEVNEDWIVTYWNKEAERLLLMPRAKILGNNLWEVFREAISLRFFTEYRKAIDEHISVRFEEYIPLRQMWVEVAAFPTGSGLSVYFKDITASKNATEALDQERKKYTDLFNFSPVPQWVYDFSTLAFLDVNQAAVDHYGYSKETFLSMTIKDIRPAEDVESLKELISTEVIPGLFNKSSVRHQKSNGQIISVCVEGNSLCFEGRDARLVMVIDRTAEIKTSRALEESLRRFDIVSKATSDAIWDWDMSSGEIIWNKGIKGIFGYDQAFYDREWQMEQIHPDDVSRVQEELKMLITSKESRFKIEYKFRCADGSYRSVLDRAFIISNEQSEPVRMIGSMQDITAQVNYIHAIEEQNTKLKEISWIQSHKVRSPLTKILGLVDLISDGIQETDSIAELVAYLKQSAEELDQVLIEITRKAK